MRDWRLKTPPLQGLSTQHLDLITVEVIAITISPLIVVEVEATITETKDEVFHLIISHNILLIKDLVQKQKALLAKSVIKLVT